jgi:hypothetical protein
MLTSLIPNIFALPATSIGVGLQSEICGLGA